MKNGDYKKIIIEMLNYLDDSDITFLKKIYTLIKRHIERGRGH